MRLKIFAKKSWKRFKLQQYPEFVYKAVDLKMTPFILACKNDNDDVVELLLQKSSLLKIDLNFKGKYLERYNLELALYFNLLMICTSQMIFFTLKVMPCPFTPDVFCSYL